MKIFQCFILVIIFSQILASKEEKYESIKKIDNKYKIISQMIKSAVENNQFLHNAAFKRLAYLSDTYGPRMWGSDQLELVIDEMVTVGIMEQFDKSYRDPVTNFTKWVRGKESLTLYDPRPFPQKINMIGLGWSVPGDVKTEVIVVTDWDDLELKKDQIKGKIVCYAYQWTNYSHGVDYRSNGAWKASQYGAVGTLIRSVTPFSIESPHTGYQHYEEGVTKIPTAAISVEDANMFLRMQNRGQKIVVHLYLENEEVDNQNSANYIAEITGSEKPEEVVLFG